MPGICGFITSPTSREDLSDILRAMQDALAHESWHVRAGHSDHQAGAALGSVSLGFNGQSTRIVRDAATQSTIALDGALYDARAAATGLRRAGCDVDERDHASILLAGYVSLGAAFLKGLHGSFAAALWDGRNRQLTLITDRFGSRPVYCLETAQGLRFSSGLASLL